jgi:predicted ATPase/DNA-binding CsgD family transcriptional regulator
MLHRARATQSHDLPTTVTSLIGREQDVAVVRQLVVDAERHVVTLTGTGGCGKSRLALKVAYELADTFSHGAWWVELAALSDASLVPQAVAAVLGVREQRGQTLVELLSVFVAQRQLLLVLDNCEHLIDACARLSDALLHASGTLRLLTTSREALRIPGEVSWRVPSLSLPPRDVVAEPAELGQYSAVRLFVQRAQDIQPTFSITRENASTVAAVSARLEGLPLAIQLAAAWVRVLGIEQVLQRLDATFRSELGSTRMAPSRQQTMWATLDWSYALINEPERVLLRRLSVFAGGWSLEDAESVCSGREVERGRVLEHLTRLVDSSLVQVEERSGYARFRLLEPVRVYASERQVASEEDLSVRQSHAEAFLALGEQLSGRVQYWRPTGKGLDRLELEHDNFRAALRWSLDSGWIEQGLRIAATLGNFWVIRGHFSEGRRWIASLVDAPGSEADSEALARVLGLAGNLAWNAGDALSAQTLHRRSLDLYQSLPNCESSIAAVLCMLGLDAQSHGDYVDAEAFCTQALTLARSQKLAWVEGLSLFHLGFFACERMDWVKANDRFQEALRVASRTGDAMNVARAFNGMGLMAHAQGDYVGARDWHVLALEKRRELREAWGVAFALVCLGGVLLDLAELGQARALLIESISISQELGDRQGLARCLEAFAGMAAVEHHPEVAFRLVGAAEALRDRSELPLSPIDSLHLERHLGIARREIDESVATTSRALGYALSVEDAVALALQTDKENDTATFSGLATTVPTSSLTQRQYEVALLVGQGLSNRQIAKRLIITERTAGAHIEHILDKLGFTSRTQIAVWVAGSTPADSQSR